MRPSSQGNLVLEDRVQTRWERKPLGLHIKQWEGSYGRGAQCVVKDWVPWEGYVFQVMRKQSPDGRTDYRIPDISIRECQRMILCNSIPGPCFSLTARQYLSTKLSPSILPTVSLAPSNHLAQIFLVFIPLLLFSSTLSILHLTFLTCVIKLICEDLLIFELFTYSLL
jgi:hypothetical protein